MIHPSQAHRHTPRGRSAALLALATAAAVLVPLAPPVGANTNSQVTVAAHEDWVYEGATASFTFTAKPAPAQDLTVTYSITETHNTHGGNGSDQGVLGRTIIIPAGQTSAVVDIGLRKDMQFRWTSDTDAPKYKLNGSSFGPFCKNSADSGKPYHNPPDHWENNDRDVPAQFAKWPAQALHPDYACSEKSGQIGMLHTSTIGSIGVRITGVSAGGTAGSPKYDATKVRDRSLWKERLTIAQSGGNTTVAENGGTDTYTVALTLAPSHDVTVTAKSANPAAATVKTNGAAGASATLTFTPQNWSTPQAVTVTGVDDSVVNTDGRRSANITHAVASSDTRYQGKERAVTATVSDDDAANAAIDLSVDVTEVSEDVAASPTVTVTAAVANGVTFEQAKTVAVSVAGSGTSNAVGFAANPFSFNIAIPSGQRSATGTFTLNPTDNNTSNADETVTVSGTLSGVTVNPAQILLTDDETNALPRVSLSVDHTTISENSDPQRARFIVYVNRAPAADIDVAWTVSGGTATSGEDFAPPSKQTFRIPSGRTESIGYVYFTALNDTDSSEGNETFTVTLSAGSGYRLGLNTSATITIADNTQAPSQPVVRFQRAAPDDYSNGSDPDGHKRAESAGTELVYLTVDPVPASDTTVHYSLSGTATLNSDYSITGVTNATATVAVPAFTRFVTIPVDFTDDSTTESEETVILTLTAGSGYTLGATKIHTITITDDDTGATPGVTVSKTSVTVAENSGEEDYTVVLDNRPAGSVTIRAQISVPTEGYAARVGSKTDGVFSAVEHLTFTAQDWNTPQTVTVRGVDDNVDNPGDKRTATISHTISSGDGNGYTGTLNIASVDVQVGDDDTAPSTKQQVVPVATVGSTNYTGGEAAGSRSLSVAVSLDSPAPQGGLTIGYTVGGTATPGSDYTALGSSLSFAGGSSSGTISVAILDDSIDDDGESITITLTAGSGYSLGTPKKTTITITDDDSPAPVVDDQQQDNDPQPIGPSTPSTDTSSSSDAGGASSGQTVRPIVDLTLGDASQDSIALGESSEMTVELERSVSSIVRVFIEIDSTAVLGTDYTVDADVGDGWVSLGDNPRRVVFDLPRRDTDAAIRVTSLDTSTTDTTVTLTVTIGDRSFAGGSVVTIRPQGTAEVVSLGDPDAAPAESDDGPGGDRQDPDDGTGTTEADPETDGDGADQGDAGTAEDGDGDRSDLDGTDTETDGSGTDGADDGDAGTADDGHVVDPESLGTVTRTADGYFVLYTVRPGDTLSSIALTFYRDDEAYRHIFTANRGRRMSDGYTFTSADMIRAGWVLRVPLPIAAPSLASAAKMAYVTYCVMSGDMLSGIAQRIYGDGSLYNRIVVANRGQRQANGQTFVHGDRIAPGWLLRIPVGG